MFRSRLVRSALAILVLACTSASAGVQAANTCEDFIGNTTYRCNVQGEDLGGVFEDCFRFNSAEPVVSAKFDLTVDLLGDTLGCSCMATGSFTNPRPGASKIFTCVGPNSDAAFTGKVAANRSVKGFQAIFSDGFSYVISCTRDENCNVQPTFASPALESPYKRR